MSTKNVNGHFEKSIINTELTKLHFYECNSFHTRTTERNEMHDWLCVLMRFNNSVNSFIVYPRKPAVQFLMNGGIHNPGHGDEFRYL